MSFTQTAQLACSLGLALVCCTAGGCSTAVEELPKQADPAITQGPPPERPESVAYAARPQNSLTFSKDIAPIVLQKCATCHHPGAVGPFPLLTYGDVKKRGRQIVEVTANRIMPPWAPLPGYCVFERDRSLSSDEIGMISQWVDEGAREGNPSDLPPAPEFPGGWKHGKPDLVVSMPEPFQVPAESTADVYRKFVIRVPIEETKYVSNFDFDPGNQGGVVHHARLRVDRSSLSRAQDQQDRLPGFDGTMFSGDTEPDGFFLVWTPGYEAVPKRGEVAWTLQKGTDLVLELHLHPTGKEETIQSSIALYFQSTPPRDRLLMLPLECQTIDIAAGEKDKQYEDRYVLPADATVIAAMPHAHYLATEFRSWAVLPDGRKIWLMRIADWDFNWQREYTYSEPISLPKGTALWMQVTYNNSRENPRNPHRPPRRAVIGRDTNDEMAQVFLQVMASTPAEEELLNTSFRRKEFEGSLEREQFLVKVGRASSEGHFNLGCLYSMAGDLPRALHHYQESIRLKADNVFALNNLGSLYRKIGRDQQAIDQYTRALKINPSDARVRYNLGLVYLDYDQVKQASQEFEAALRINPEFAEPCVSLGLLALKQEDFQQAERYFERATKANPDLETARVNLRRVRARIAGAP